MSQGVSMNVVDIFKYMACRLIFEIARTHK